MKAIILAAGNGTRLHPLTATIPKCLVPIRGIPMLQIWLDLCCRNGIDEVTVNVHAHSDSIHRFVESNRSPVRVRLFEEPVLLGSAGTLLANADWIGDDRELCVFYGDVLTTLNIDPMLRFHRQKGTIATIALHSVANPSECGIACVDQTGIVQEFIEKPTEPKGNLAFCGVMIVTPDVLREIPLHSPADIGYHLLPRLLGRMAGYYTREYLIDVGTMAAYQRAQQTRPGVRCQGHSEPQLLAKNGHGGPAL